METSDMEIILSNYLNYDDFHSEDELNVFNSILYELDPMASKCDFEDIFEGFFGIKSRPEPIWENTLHENIFSKLFPFLEKQVVFGLGEGAYKKYKALKYTADFYDPKELTVWEIDGESHSSELQKLKDRKRDLILGIEFSIETVRVTNEEVERLLLDRIRSRNVVRQVEIVK